MKPSSHSPPCFGCLFLLALLTGAAASGQSVPSGLGGAVVDADGEILTPGTVEADLAPTPPQPAPAGPIFPDFVLPGRVSLEAWRDDLDDRANLRFGLN